MKIIQLTAENIKKLVAVDITPTGNLVEITGKNGQGKTSVLDSIWWALGGDKVVQDKPIRDGADKGTITLDLGQYKVVRTFKRRDDGTITKSITVTNADGFKASNPQEILKGLVGNLSFDPLAFSRMKTEEQVVALRGLVPNFDFAANTKAVKDAFDKRTDVNREIKQLEVQFNGLNVPDDAPTEPVVASEILLELQNAMDANSVIDRQRRQWEAHLDEIKDARETVSDLEAKLKKAQEYLAELEAVDQPDIPEKADIDPIRQRLQDAERLAGIYNIRKNKDAFGAKLKEKRDESEALTTAINDLKAAASAAVKSANIPVPGLELTEDAVLLNGQPFNQASDAEQLRASIAVAGAMNPTLRIIRVRDGSLLDGDSWAALKDYVDANDLQCWLETVSSGREAAVVIEDGHVVAAAQEAAE